MPKTKVTKKFSVTIPKEIRQALNIKPGHVLVFMKEGNKAYFCNAGTPQLRNNNSEKITSSQYAIELREQWKKQEKKLGL